MSSTVTIGLAGIAGYGEMYLEALLPRLSEIDARLVGAVDPMPERCKRLAQLKAAHVPIYSTEAELFDTAGGDGIDLMLIVTPIHLHAPQTILALNRGANVLCEKPAAGTVGDAMEMLEAERATGRFAAIGFQWSFSDAVHALKRDIAAGVFGRPLRMKALAFFPRSLEYFRRNDWCGRLCAGDGRGIYDSPVNNATSHFLHNMFYLLGRSRETSAMPLTVQAELYRANDIENYDTAAIRTVTECGVELLFYTTHAVPDRIGPISQFEFEDAVIEFAAAPIDGQKASDTSGIGEFLVRFRDGRVKSYGSPTIDCADKIKTCIDAVRQQKHVPCGVRAALAHARCVAAAQRSGTITPFPTQLRHLVGTNGQQMIEVHCLQQTLLECYRRGVLPSERGEVEWAQPAPVAHVSKPHVSVHARPPRVAATANVD